MKKTAIQINDEESVRSRVLLGTPARQGITKAGKVAIFEGQSVVVYEVKHNRRYHGYLVRVGAKGHQKVKGILPQVEVLATFKTAKRIRQVVRCLKALIKEDMSLESLPDGRYARLNAVLQTSSVEDQTLFELLRNDERVATDV